MREANLQFQWVIVHTGDPIAITLVSQSATRLMLVRVGILTPVGLKTTQEHNMKLKIQTTLFAAAITALLAGPIWAATDAPKDGALTTSPATSDRSPAGQSDRSQTGAQTGQYGTQTGQSGQSDRSQSTAETPRMGAADGGATARSPMADNPLYTRSADELDGMEVVDRTGDKVGDVKQIVLAPDRKSAHAVISVGGILGMGARDIMVSLDDLTPIGDKLQMNATKDEATALKDDTPDADTYVEVKGDTPISGSIVEFSAFEQGTEGSKPGAAPMTPKTGAEMPAHPALTPDVEADRPATTPETPRVPQ